MKKLLFLIALLNASIIAFGQTVPVKGFYGGLGGSFNIVNYSAADASTFGLSNVSVNGSVISSGYAGGPFEFPSASQNRFAPSAQIGYFQKFNKSSWLWGSKLTYSYIGSSTMSSSLGIPQFGSNTTGQSFTGLATVESFENNLNSQFTLTPYIGCSVKKAFFYLGAGISYSQVEEKINDVIGYAFIQTDTVNITGAPTDFSSSDWVIGFTGTAGATYFIAPTLFLDLSYTFNRTKDQTNDFDAHFANSNGTYSTSGQMIGSTSSHLTTNSFSLTINKIF